MNAHAKAVEKLNLALSKLRFSAPVTHVYNPLEYALPNYLAYLERYGQGHKRYAFLGMNPGPFGMVQTGVPFGEIRAVRDWMKICEAIQQPSVENPSRPIEGWACQRSEVSGRRLWGLFAERYGQPEAFFQDHIVLNYCPLAFFVNGRNLTPDKLPAAEQAPLLAACDDYLRWILQELGVQKVIGVGVWAEARARAATQGLAIETAKILHPSPASPAANRGWTEAATQQMRAQSIWPEA